MDVLGNPDDSMSKMPDGALSIVDAECTAIGPPSRRQAKEDLSSVSQANGGMASLMLSKRTPTQSSHQHWALNMLSSSMVVGF
jgi:hypothetical protein